MNRLANKINITMFKAGNVFNAILFWIYAKNVNTVKPI